MKFPEYSGFYLKSADLTDFILIKLKRAWSNSMTLILKMATITQLENLPWQKLSHIGKNRKITYFLDFTKKMQTLWILRG